MAQDIDIDLDDVTPAPKKAKAAKPTPVIDLEEPAQPDASVVDIDINSPALVETKATAPVADNAIPNGRDLLNQLLGQAQAFDAASQLLRTFGVSKLAYIKETKAYKEHAGAIAPNGSVLKGTWEEFCGLIGMSVDKVDADIANLRAFGEGALEAMNGMGIGYRDLAQYRKLPVDERAALIAAAETGDKNHFLDLAETIIERHATEKAESEEIITGLTNDLDIAKKRTNNMDAEIERLERTNERLAKQQRITTFEPFTEDVRHESLHLQAGVELHLDSLRQLFFRVYENEQTAEQSLRIDQVYISIVVAVSRGLDLLESIHQHFEPERIPDRIKGQHVMTTEEATRWLLEWESLTGAHKAGETARQIARDEAKPRKPGRPNGSKNKAE